MIDVKKAHKFHRTCVICRSKLLRNQAYRFTVINHEIVIDLNHRIKSYGYYICESEKCHLFLNNWLNKKNKKRKTFEISI